MTAWAGSELRSAEVEQQRFLYHYTRASRTAQILDSEEFWLGPYTRTNDPRESKEWVPAISWIDNAVPTAGMLDETYEVQRNTDRFLRRGARLGCFGLDRE